MHPLGTVTPAGGSMTTLGTWTFLSAEGTIFVFIFSTSKITALTSAVGFLCHFLARDTVFTVCHSIWATGVAHATSVAGETLLALGVVHETKLLRGSVSLGERPRASTVRSRLHTSRAIISPALGTISWVALAAAACKPWLALIIAEEARAFLAFFASVNRIADTSMRGAYPAGLLIDWWLSFLLLVIRCLVIRCLLFCWLVISLLLLS